LPGEAARCGSCGAPLATDQRYCLQCGERTAAMSSVLLGGPPTATGAGPARPDARPTGGPPPDAGSPAARGAGDGGSHDGTLMVIAGVGVLLLAMGVGVLIGRSTASAGKASDAPQVIVAPSGTAGTGAGSGAEAAFTDDWPAGTSGWTVQLKSLPQAGTAPSAVAAAKAEATAKGAKEVGALKSEDFSSLAAGSYVIYSGVDHTRAQAEQALAGLRKSFPGASVIRVSNTSSTSSQSTPEAPAAGGKGSSPSNPAPPAVVESERKGKGVSGKSFEEKSRNLPDVISTG
jgi:hypothetical protein